MTGADSRADAYFAAAGRWQAELLALRAILRSCPVTEQFKWRSPCYTYRDANVAILWAFRESCGLGFFKGVLLTDPNRILVAPGENSRSTRVVRFTGVGEIVGMEAILRETIGEAVELERQGRKVDLPKDDLRPPRELTELLDRDPDLKAAFAALTPGRRRGYILHFSQPKHAATRAGRIDKSRSRILAGKGLHDR